MQQDDAKYKAKELEQKGTGSYGYGGKFGVQQDRMDKVSDMFSSLHGVFPCARLYFIFFYYLVSASDYFCTLYRVSLYLEWIYMIDLAYR